MRLHVAVFGVEGRCLVVETSLLRGLLLVILLTLVLLTEVGGCMRLFSAHTVGHASVLVLLFVLLLLLHHHLVLLHHLQVGVGLTIQIVHLVYLNNFRSFKAKFELN